MGKTKQVLKEILPPFLVKFIKWIWGILPKSGPEYELIPEGWRSEQLNNRIKGWNVEDILKVYLSRWPAFVASAQSTKPLGCSPEETEPGHFDLIYHNTLLVFGYSLAIATHEKKKIKILDWGGGIGHYYLLSKVLAPGLEIEYTCKDVPVLAAYGQKLFPDARFCSDESCLKESYDFILASCSLHYSEDWQRVLELLARSTNGYLLVTRLPVVQDRKPFVFVQRPYKYGYNTEYLGWVVNRTELLEIAHRSSIQLAREFITGEVLQIYKVPFPCEYRAFLFTSENKTAV